MAEIHREGREFYDDGYDASGADDKGDSDSALLSNQITFTSDRLFGREEELQQLLDTFHLHYSAMAPTKNGKNEVKTIGGSVPPLVMVHGQSGSGKSCLVEHLFQKLESEAKVGESKPFFLLSGKFEELERDPYAPIVDAFGGLGAYLTAKDVPEAERTRFRAAIATALGDELNSLLAFIPGLLPVVSKNGKQKHLNMNMANAQNQLHYLFLRLLQAVSTEDRPVVLFLDDLQWVDGGSLDLLISILNENVEHFMVIGAYRSNEVDKDHPLAKELETLLEQGKEVKAIPLSNWSVDDVQSFVSQTLELEEDEETHSLAEAIYGKTRGNALFTRQAMEELHRKDFLFYSRISFRWEWNEKGLEELEAGISDDVLGAIVAKIHNLPQQLQRTLVVASYTRSVFHADTLSRLLKADANFDEEEDLTGLLEVAVLEGILSNRVGSRSYQFRHDSFQEAARSLVTRGAEQEKLKQWIALELYQVASSKDRKAEDWMIYVAADHLNSITLSSAEEWVLRAKVNAECGKKAFRVAAFVPAARYFQTGVDVLRKIPNHWEGHYDLTLRLYRGLSAVTLALGFFETGHDYGKTLLQKAKSFADKIPTYMSMAVALGREDHHMKALELCQAALALTGDHPERRLAFRAKRELSSVSRYWKRHSDEEILCLPCLTDQSVLSKMALYYQVGLRAIVCGKRDIWLRSFLRQLQLTTQHGLCGLSPMGFAFYAMHLTSVGDRVGAQRNSRLARALIDRKEDKRQEGLTRYILGLYVEDWERSPNSVLTDFEAGHKAAMEVGDIEAGFCNWGGSSFVAFVAGHSLDVIERDGRARIEQMKLYHEAAMLNIFKAIQFPALALTGRWPCNGDPIDWDNFVDNSIDFADSSKYLWTIHYCLGRMAVAVYFGKFQVAKRLSGVLPSLGVEGFSIVSSAIFLAGMTTSRLYQATGEKRYLKELRATVKDMRKLVEVRTPGKMGHRLEILQAQVLTAATTRNDRVDEGVSLAYDNAISSAVDAGQINDAALSSEFAGEYFAIKRQVLEAKIYLQRALSLYDKWGACVKVEDIKARLRTVLKEHSSRNST